MFGSAGDYADVGFSISVSEYPPRSSNLA